MQAESPLPKLLFLRISMIPQPAGCINMKLLPGQAMHKHIIGYDVHRQSTDPG